MTTLSTTGPTPEPFAGDTFQILALDGGGARALFTAHVLAHFEEDLGVRVADCFDLIAGTSAGGIVALGLGAGLRPREIVEHYLELVTTVFPRGRHLQRPLRARSPFYSGLTLENALTTVLADKILGDSEKRLLIPSWDLHRGQVHLFKTPHSPRLTRDARVKMVDVALATSAAPLFFPAATVEHTKLIDGGVFANNPSVFAIAEATSMIGVPLKAIKVLNIGTMEPFTDHSDRLDDAGYARWATKAAPLILAAGSAGQTGLARHLIGFDNFVRLDALVPAKLFALDRIDPQKVASYAGSVSRDLTPEFQAKFAQHAAAAYTPSHQNFRTTPVQES